MQSVAGLRHHLMVDRVDGDGARAASCGEPASQPDLDQVHAFGVGLAGVVVIDLLGEQTATRVIDELSAATDPEHGEPRR